MRFASCFELCNVLPVKWRDNRLIEPISENARKYAIRLSHSLLSRGLIQALDKEGFIATDENGA